MELLAVIVILAIILVIAVPKVMSVIEDAKKATLESTAKMIAGSAEKAKVQNTVLGKTEDITCDSVAKINSLDYETCEVDFEDNTAKVSIKGSGKFEGLYVCNATKIEAIAQTEECGFDGVELPALGTSAEDCSWEQIKAIGDAGKVDEYFNLGDIKTIELTDGTEVEMQIVAFNADEKVDGSGTAAITWISKDMIAQHVMNSAQTNAGGWEASEMRSWLQGTFYGTLPTDVKENIVTVQKTYGDYNGGSYVTKECNDNVWIPSYLEIFGYTSYETFGAVYTSYFTDGISRMKTFDGANVSWWLRSAYIYGSTQFAVIGGGGGYANGYTAENCYGVTLGFCT